MKYVWWWISIHTWWLILISIFLVNKANAQTLSWQRPEPRKNEQGVVISSEPTGYRILYEIQREHNKCLQYVGIRPRYSLDLGNVTKYDLQEDINFQKGMTYYIAIVAYTIDPIIKQTTQNDKLLAIETVGYRVIESPATSHACVVIRGIPEGVEFEGVYNEEYINNYTEENENEEIIIASTSVPSADGTGGISEIHDTAQRTRHERSGSIVANHADKNLLGKYGDVTRPSDRSGRTATNANYFDRQRSDHDNMGDKHVKPRLVSGDQVPLPSNSIKRDGSGRDARERQVASRIKTDATQAESTDSDGSIKYSAISLATLLVVVMMIWRRSS